jgi:NAD(P)-dependent dehydrogenase (short-subunit alcohol dehydrogenase family)
MNTMSKFKKALWGGTAAALAGVGVCKFINARHNEAANHWTTADIPDLTGKVMIVTGANSGIGFETVKEFARKGAQTILACRRMDKGWAAFDQIQSKIPYATMEILQLDLSDLSSVRAFVETYKAKYNRLDVLVNNAGIMSVPHRKTADGFESQLGINHLGHFALTGLLLDVILATPRARVVNVSSIAHWRGHMNFENLMFDGGKGYGNRAAYQRSKLANLLFTYELERYFEEHGLDTIAVAAHPGVSNTDLADHVKAIKILRPFVGWILQSAAMGALPIIRAAVDPDVNGGQYYGPGGRNERRGYPVIVGSSEASQNLQDAKDLWQVSEALTGVSYRA